MNNLVVLSILVVLVGGAYTLLVHYKAPERKWEWWHSFIATVLSIRLVQSPLTTEKK